MDDKDKINGMSMSEIQARAAKKSRHCLPSPNLNETYFDDKFGCGCIVVCVVALVIIYFVCFWR